MTGEWRACPSKIAHMQRFRLWVCRAGIASTMRGHRRRHSFSWESLCVSVNFLGALKADPVRVFVDREHTAQMAMTASENELKNPTQEIYKFYTRCRRSHIPLTSNHSRR